MGIVKALDSYVDEESIANEWSIHHGQIPSADGSKARATNS
jgi:hypothetical protein